MSDRDNHGMNCAHRSDSDEPCTCACRHHAAVDTERTMHAAWRKRAEQAERENADLRARLAAVTKDRDNELADNTGLALKIAAVSEELDNFKALASRETSRRLEAEKARDEQAEAVRVLAEACGNLSGLVHCETWCDARRGGHCKCGNEQDHAAIVDGINNNPTAAAAVKEASK